MNIFYLDEDLTLCAQYHCDKHVVKMILEYSQILCTVLHQQGLTAPYRATHRSHPCILWANQSLENWLWLQDLTAALNKEYQYRFKPNHSHQSALIAKALPPPPLVSQGLTIRPQVMPEKYRRSDNIIEAYRLYYLSEKSQILNYTKRNLPYWLHMVGNAALI